MNKQLLTGLTIVGVAASAGVAYAGVSVIHSVSAEDVTASTAPAQQVTRTIVYQVGGAGQVTINVAGDSLAVNGSAAASGWSVVAASATGTHAEVQFTDGVQLVTFSADLVADEIAWPSLTPRRPAPLRCPAARSMSSSSATARPARPAAPTPTTAHHGGATPGPSTTTAPPAATTMTMTTSTKKTSTRKRKKMTDADDQAARLAAIRARRGQAPIDPMIAAATAAPVATTDQAARLAAIRAQRGQQPVAIQGFAAPAAPVRQMVAAAPAARSKSSQRVAAGARIVVTGLSASAVFGITTAIAAANQPTYTAAPASVPTATTASRSSTPTRAHVRRDAHHRARCRGEHRADDSSARRSRRPGRGSSRSGSYGRTGRRPARDSYADSHRGARSGPGTDTHHRRPGPHRTPHHHLHHQRLRQVQVGVPHLTPRAR
jgi:hypothetical protein